MNVQKSVEMFGTLNKKFQGAVNICQSRKNTYMKIATLLLLMSFTAHAQSDTEIVNMVLGEKYVNIANKLKDAGIWHHNHFRNTQTTSGQDNAHKTFSIQNGAGRTKVWRFEFDNDNIIDVVIINYRHDDRGQVEDMEQMRDFDDYHIGSYSTDITYKLKSAKKKK